LIRFGHGWNDIQNYTAAQIKLFLKSIEQIEKEERQAAITDNAIASQGDEKSINKAIQQLKQ
jgi:hypothetical protein